MPDTDPRLALLPEVWREILRTDPDLFGPVCIDALLALAADAALVKDLSAQLAGAVEAGRKLAAENTTLAAKAARVDALETDVARWRRVAERIENEKQDSYAEQAVANESLRTLRTQLAAAEERWRRHQDNDAESCPLCDLERERDALKVRVEALEPIVRGLAEDDVVLGESTQPSTVALRLLARACYAGAEEEPI